MKFLIISIVLLLSACMGRDANRVLPPVAAIDIPFALHRFHADSGTVIQLPSGTRIEIPPGIWVDRKGLPIRDQVDFRIREFHSAKDLFRSGIPMDLRSASPDRLQSAGMIEMHAYTNEGELSILPGRSIEVGLAGYRNSNGYDLWYLENGSEWNRRGVYQVDSNTVKWQTIRSLKDTLKKPRSPEEDQDRIFELISNTLHTPHLKPYMGMKWMLNESVPVDSLQSGGRVHWSDVHIKKVKRKKDLYELTFTLRYRMGSSEEMRKTILAHPITTRSDMKTRMQEYEKELAQIEERERKRKERLSRAERQADLIQSFKADRMGIWNIDRLMKMDDCVPISVQFDFERSKKYDRSDVRLFALYDEDNSVYEFKSEEWDRIFLQKGKSMRLIGVLPDDQLAIVESKEIKAAIETGNSFVNFKTRIVDAKTASF